LCQVILLHHSSHGGQVNPLASSVCLLGGALSHRCYNCILHVGFPSGMFVQGTFTLCSFLPLSTPLFLSLALLFHSPSYTLKSPSRNLSWKPVYCHTHASRTSFCEQFFYMQIAFVSSRAFSVQSSTEIITFLSEHGFFYKFKVDFS